MNNTREAGVIVGVRIDADERPSVWVTIDYDAGATQGFGGLYLEKSQAKLFCDELCYTFDVENVAQLKGKKCFALKNFPYHNEYIQGLEAPSGKRFTIYGFQKRHFPKVAKDPLTSKIDSIETTISSAQRRLKEAKEELKVVRKDFVNWEK